MNQSKTKDHRFWNKWWKAGAIGTAPFSEPFPLPFFVAATSHLYKTGWNTISCLNERQTPNHYFYFVTRQNLQFDTLYDKLPNDAIPFSKGRHLVTLK